MPFRELLLTVLHHLVVSLAPFLGSQCLLLRGHIIHIIATEQVCTASIAHSVHRLLCSLVRELVVEVVYVAAVLEGIVAFANRVLVILQSLVILSRVLSVGLLSLTEVLVIQTTVLVAHGVGFGNQVVQAGHTGLDLLPVGKAERFGQVVNGTGTSVAEAERIGDKLAYALHHTCHLLIPLSKDNDSDKGTLPVNNYPGFSGLYHLFCITTVPHDVRERLLPRHQREQRRPNRADALHHREKWTGDDVPAVLFVLSPSTGHHVSHHLDG